MMFADRADGGRRLAAELVELHLREPIVLGLPRGGVVVAWEVAQRLGAPLDVIVVRKLGVPWQPELAMGAIGEDGVRVLDQRVLRETGVSDGQISAVERQEQRTLAGRVRQLRGGRPPAPVRDRTVIIVDDGIATGSTARAACRVARERGAAAVVLAVPVGPHGVQHDFAGVADRVVCLSSPRGFSSVGAFYRNFDQTSDDEVARILTRAGDSPTG